MRQSFLAAFILVLATIIVCTPLFPPSVLAETQTFSNATPIQILDRLVAEDPRPANPHPSNIEVRGLTGTIVDVNVTLHGFSHTWPDDVDILLVGPGGQSVLLMSDAGGGGETNVVNNITLTFDQSSVNLLSDEGPLQTGVYLPTDYPGASTPDAVPPAPPGPYVSTLDIFNGTDPNGIWSLYVQDDTPGDSGIINGGWSLEITTGSPPAITSSPTAIVTAGTPFTHTFTATGDPTPTLSYANANLPPEITLLGDTLFGTPITAGNYTIDVIASNKVAPDAMQTFTLTVVNAPGMPQPTASPTPNFPPPPASPHAEDVNLTDDDTVRTFVPEQWLDSIHVRVLYQNGQPAQWRGNDLYHAGNIGVQGVLDLGVWQAIDIFTTSGLNYFDGGVVFCLRGEGTLIWLAASRAPRIAEIISSHSIAAYPGYTCATIFEPGLLVLVQANPSL